jgi:hypothetical protein
MKNQIQQGKLSFEWLLRYFDSTLFVLNVFITLIVAILGFQINQLVDCKCTFLNNSCSATTLWLIGSSLLFVSLIFALLALYLRLKYSEIKSEAHNLHSQDLIEDEYELNEYDKKWIAFSKKSDFLISSMLVSFAFSIFFYIITILVSYHDRVFLN